MRIREQYVADVTILGLDGNLDATTAQVLTSWVHISLSNSPKALAINLEDVNFIDSTGLSALVQVMKRCLENSVHLLLFGLQPQVNQIFSYACLDSVFNIFETEAAALEAWEQPIPKMN